MKYTKTHEWINTQEADGNQGLSVGITDHAQQLLGDLVFVELPKEGIEVQAGDEIGVVESVKAASDFYAPISGTITAINDQVSQNPSLINSDPLGAGWLVKIKPQSNETFAQLLDSEAYQQLIHEA